MRRFSGRTGMIQEKSYFLAPEQSDKCIGLNNDVYFFFCSFKENIFLKRKKNSVSYIYIFLSFDHTRAGL